MQKPALTPKELAKHVELIASASTRDRDELLTDLLCHVYRTKASQNG